MNIYIGGGSRRGGPPHRPPRQSASEQIKSNLLYMATQGIVLFLFYIIAKFWLFLMTIIIGLLLYLWKANRRYRLGGNRKHSCLLDEYNNMNIIPPSPPNNGGGGCRPNCRRRRHPSYCEKAMWHELWAKAIEIYLFLCIFIIAYFITFIQRINPFNQESPR